MKRLLLAVLAASAIACGNGTPSAPTGPTPSGSTLSAAARLYLDQFINVLQSNSVNRLTIDWTKLRADVFAAAGTAQTIPDLLPAIRVAIAGLGDGHSSYRSASGTVIFVGTRICSGSGGASAPPLPDSIGYVAVSSFSGTPNEALAFANNIQGVIRSRDRADLAGWIVDLRGNTGGNMWPMIAGLGPVLGDALLGYFLFPNGAETQWEYRDGASRLGNNLAQRVDAPYRLQRENPRVAVLTDGAVASSGEATAVSFRQRPGTRSFGTPTCGLSTSNSPFTFTDGATLNLTTSVMADRTKFRYGDRIEPDETIADRNQLIARAVAWLQTGS